MHAAENDNDDDDNDKDDPKTNCAKNRWHTTLNRDELGKTA